MHAHIITNAGTRFAHPRILQAYTAMLTTFEQNSLETNHSCVKLLHRIAIDAKMAGMLLQARLFAVLQPTLCSRLAKLGQFSELKNFTRFLVAKLVSVAESNDKVIVVVILLMLLPLIIDFYYKI